MKTIQANLDNVSAVNVVFTQIQLNNCSSEPSIPPLRSQKIKYFFNPEVGMVRESDIDMDAPQT
jgi:hypothetical protein